MWQATPAAIHLHPLAPGREYENLKHFKYVIEKRKHITEKEMEEYNYMVHFGRVTQGVLTALTEQYCSTKSCGNLINQDLGKSFDLNRLKSVAESYFNLTERIQQFIKSTGHIGGCMFVLYIVIQMFIRLGHAYYLYKNRNHRLHTAFLSAFHRTKVIQEHLLELRELVNANDQNGRD